MSADWCCTHAHHYLIGARPQRHCVTDAMFHRHFPAVIDMLHLGKVQHWALGSVRHRLVLRLRREIRP